MSDVLIVDDEEDICDELKESLQELGLEAGIALSGEEALRLIEKYQWRLFIIDLKLSTRITGLDVVRAIRNKWPEATVAVMTGYIDIGLKQEAEKLRVNAYMMKPDDIQCRAFKERIQKLLGL